MLLTLLLTVFRVKELTLVFAPLPLPRPPPPPLFHGSYKCNYCSLACKHLSSGCGRTGGGGGLGVFACRFLPPTNTDLRVTLLRLHP